MKNTHLHALVAGFVLFCLVSLALGLGWLEIVLPGGFPLGTVATWLMFIALGWSLLNVASRMTRRRQMAWLGLLLAIAWYPFSIFKAGNVTLTFYGDGQPWVIWTAVVAGWLLVLGAWTGISAVRRKQKSR